MKYTFQKILIYLLIFSFYGCKEESDDVDKKLEDIPLQLESEFSFGYFFPQRELANTLEENSVQLKNIPKDFIDYEVKSFTFNLAQAYYQEWKEGKISTEEFELLQKIYQIDTTQLSSTKIPSQVFIVIGELANGNRAVVVDTDLDSDFAEEALHEFEYPIQFIDEDDEEYYELHKTELLPNAEVKYGEDEKFTLLIDPYEGDMNRNAHRDKYFLAISIPHILSQEFKVADKLFAIEAKNSFTQIGKPVEKMNFLAFEKNDSTSVQEQDMLRFQLNDTINLNHFDFQLVYENNEFILKNLGFNDRPVGVTEGFYLPNIEANYIDGKAYSAKAYKGKLQLFYFWTTWSVASIEDVDVLKKLQAEEANLAIVGVAIDANQGGVQRMIARQNMDWKTLYASPEQKDETKPALQFKVMSFPTYILVDEDQKILKRSHHLKEIVEKLKE